MDGEKLSGVLEWPVPTKVKQVQAFLGFVNFYCRFIENFAKMSKLLSDLTKKDSTWTWGIEQQNAFEALKKTFITAPVLRIPNDKDPLSYQPMPVILQQELSYYKKTHVPICCHDLAKQLS